MANHEPFLKYTVCEIMLKYNNLTLTLPCSSVLGISLGAVM